MIHLLAQFIPGYSGDVVTKGGGPSHIFDSFTILFSPFDPNQSLALLISKLIMYAIVIAGLIFFIQLISAGFSYLTSAGDSAKIQSATKSLTTALIGLLVVISAFFLAQIVQVIFGIQIL